MPSVLSHAAALTCKSSRRSVEPYRNALMIEPQPIEAAQLGAIASAAGPAVMTLRHDDVWASAIEGSTASR
jgi:hypothetical protein